MFGNQHTAYNCVEGGSDRNEYELQNKKSLVFLTRSEPNRTEQSQKAIYKLEISGLRRPEILTIHAAKTKKKSPINCAFTASLFSNKRIASFLLRLHE